MLYDENRVLHTPPLAFLARDRVRIAVDPARPHWVATDPRGESILRLIDGRRTLGEVSRAYGSQHGLDLGKSWVHVLTLTQSLCEAGLVADAPLSRAPYGGRLAECPPTALRELWLHTNNSCNLTCTHCLVSSHPQGDRGLPASTLSALIRQGPAAGVRRFYFTGGEPFLREDSPALIDQVTRELGSELIVLTNATLFLGARRKMLSARDRERLKLQVSLDGTSAAVNDPLRGEGTFARIKTGLCTVAELGFTTSVTCVVTRANIETLPDLAPLVASCGVKSMHLMWMHRRGRALERLSSQFPATDDLLALVRAVRARCREAGVELDNVASILRRVNAPSGIKHDLGNAGWDSLCVYSSGKVYPSAALANHPALACGDALEAPLDRIWDESPVCRDLRAASLVRKESVRDDPLRFLTGGGDVEHSYLYAEAVHGRGSFLGPDPYYDLTREIALDAMFELAEEGRRARNPRMGFDAPLLYHAMGDRAVDCGTPEETLDLDHPVRTLHSNCVLAFDVDRPHQVVQRFYAAAATTPAPELCCPASSDPEDLAHIPQAVLERSYGCGSPIGPAALAPGETVVDLGSGGGIDCFIAARKVGPQGRVIGIDMTDAMLVVAEENRPLVEKSLGYANVEFRKGLLEKVPVDDRSVSLVTSNCVINLSPDKKAVFAQMWRILADHGRAVVSDIVTEVPVPAHLRINPRLWGECLSGALTEQEFIARMREAGFHGISVLKKVFWKEVAGYRFHSVTVRGYKFEKKAGCVYAGQRATYRGPFEAVVDEEGHIFPRNVGVEVCTDTAEKLCHAPYAGSFIVSGGPDDKAREESADTCCSPGGSCC